MGLVVNSIVNRNYEGEIEGPEDTVKIVRPNAATVKDYDGTAMTIEKLSSSDQTLTPDHKKYFAFVAEDDDNVSRYVSAFADESFQDVLKAAQLYVLGKYTGAAEQVTFDEAGGDSLDARIADAGEALDDNEAPDGGRWLVLPPHAVRLIEDGILGRNTARGDEASRVGFQGMYRGFEVYKAPSSHFTITGSAPAYAHALAGQRSAITYADAVVSIRSNPSLDFIGTQVDGLHVAASKVVRSKALVDFRIKQ